MFLEKLEIQGFKSFAGKNSLVFPGKVAARPLPEGFGEASRAGITAIVGPNGSGKSNVADAVRWALGEQSMKMLRGKKSEDIIFSGSDKKGKLGLAEVSLYLNNADHQAPLDYEQVVITRRLFRDGDSEYLLNGNRVRLFDIQMLLAQANFGQKTYSVIGQGMVENFLNTSLIERKEFFDEATGVKQYQIKREDALNKLKLSLENLGQSQMLLAEIEPRLKSLTKQVARFAKKEESAAELKELSWQFYGRLWQELSGKLNAANQLFLELEAVKRDKEKKRSAWQRELDLLERQGFGAADFTAWQTKLNEQQREKDALTAQIAKLEAWLEVKLEEQGKFDLSFLTNKQRELGEDKKKIAAESSCLSSEIAADKKISQTLSGERQVLTNRLAELNEELRSFGRQLPDDKSDIKGKLSVLLEKLESAEALDDVVAIRKILSDIRQDLKNLVVDQTEDTAAALALMQQSIFDLSQKKDIVTEEFNQVSLRLGAKEARLKFLADRTAQLNKELSGLEKKLSAQQAEVGAWDRRAEREVLQKRLAEVNQSLDYAREQFSSLQATQEEKRTGVFALQKNLQALQNDISVYDARLNQEKINATRYETRLEDVESEIRENRVNLGEIKIFKYAGEADSFDGEAAHERIRQLRRQLDAIGSIDDEVEKDYAETKERYDFLSGQVNDLTSAISSLEQVIAQLDAVIKERFDQEFKIIESKFSEYFKILFNGGSAKIVKVMAEDLAAENEQTDMAANLSFKDKVMKKLKALSRHDSVGLAGIDIVATPPGKKIQSVAMLSGGERALTAIALICAIISANPSPFVVLDEVDAVLDEANSGRLAKILDDLSHKTQFIAITHNRSMMRRAQILYGVTMGDDSVSKLLSVKLEEAASDIVK